MRLFSSCVFVWRLAPELTIAMRERLQQLRQNPTSVPRDSPSIRYRCPAACRQRSQPVLKTPSPVGRFPSHVINNAAAHSELVVLTLSALLQARGVQRAGSGWSVLWQRPRARRGRGGGGGQSEVRPRWQHKQYVLWQQPQGRGHGYCLYINTHSSSSSWFYFLSIQPNLKKRRRKTKTKQKENPACHVCQSFSYCHFSSSVRFRRRKDHRVEKGKTV